MKLCLLLLILRWRSTHQGGSLCIEAEPKSLLIEAEQAGGCRYDFKLYCHCPFVCQGRTKETSEYRSKNKLHFPLLLLRWRSMHQGSSLCIEAEPKSLCIEVELAGGCKIEMKPLFPFPQMLRQTWLLDAGLTLHIVLLASNCQGQATGGWN
eukprot:7044291-Ditylum_brightwellii.AAC.1